MPDMSLSMSLEDRQDDLPKTLRNPSLRTSDAPLPKVLAQAATLPGHGHPPEAVVTDIRIPFFRLVMFLMKVALAAVPALLLAGVILFGVAHVIGTLYPDLVKMKVHIYVPPK